MICGRCLNRRPPGGPLRNDSSRRAVSVHYFCAIHGSREGIFWTSIIGLNEVPYLNTVFTSLNTSMVPTDTSDSVSQLGSR